MTIKITVQKENPIPVRNKKIKCTIKIDKSYDFGIL